MKGKSGRKVNPETTIFDPIQHFTDREKQIAAFDALWDNDAKWVLCFHGLSGNGKSTLVRWLIEKRCKPQKIPFSLIRFDSPAVFGDPFQIADSLADGFAHFYPKPCRKFSQSLETIADELEKMRSSLKVSIKQEVSVIGEGTVSGNIQQTANLQLLKAAEQRAYEKIARQFADLVAEFKSRTVIFIDTYEPFERTGDTELAGWLWKTLLQKSQRRCSDLRVIVGSQDDPRIPLEFASDGDDMSPFEPKDTRQLFAKFEFDDSKLADTVQKFTNGHPLLVGMALEEALNGNLTIADIRSALRSNEKPLKWLFDHILQRLKEPYKTALPWIALLQRFNHDSLPEILKSLKISFDHEDARSLKAFSFVVPLENGWRCHDLLRDTQRHHQHKAAPDSCRKFYQAAFEYYQKRLKDLSETDDLLDTLYYHFQVDIENAYKNWNSALQNARVDWNRELWGQIISTAEAATPDASAKIRADISFERGQYNYYQNQWRKALSSYDSALQLFRDVGDRLGEANTLQAIGDVHRFKDENEKALSSYDSALQLFRDVGSRLGEANTLKAIGDVHQFKKELEKALSSYDSALQLFRDVGDRLGEANTLQSIGRLNHAMEKIEASTEAFQNAIQLHKTINDGYSECVDWVYYSQMLEEQGKIEEACDAIERALPMHFALELPQTPGLVQRLLHLRGITDEQTARVYFADLLQRLNR